MAANTGTSSILPGDSLLSARVDGGLVDLKLTYQDYKLVMDSVGFLNASDDDDSKAEKLKQSDSKSPLASIDEKRALTGADEKSPSTTDSAAASKNKNSAALSPVSGVPVRSLRRLSKAQGGYLIDASALKSSFCGTHFALEEAKSFGEQSIVATFQGIKITLINNVAGVDVPFAKFDIGGLRATVDAFSHSRRVSANLNLEAMYFNQTLCAWEPMVEPWSARFDNWTTPGQDNVISLKADKPFYVNLTRGMLDSVTSSLELVTKVEAENKKAAEEKAGPSGSGDRYSSYMIRNDTDIPLKFKIGDHSKRDITGPSGFSARKDSDGTAPLLGDPPLLPGEESSLRYPQSMTQLDKRLVTVALKGYQQLPPFDLDNPQGAVEFSLESNRKGPSIGASEPLKVAVETRVVGGIRVVSVHSTVSVRNNTSIPLECSGVVVDPGARMFMPLRSGSAGVQIRPVDFPKQSKCTVSGRWDQDGKAFQPFSKNSAYATSVPVDIPELVSKMELSNAPEAKERNHRVAPHLTLTCAPRSYQLPIFNLTVVASQETTAAAREIKNENKNAAGAPPPTIVTLDLHPPLVLENALACEASFTISTKRDEDVEYDDDGTTVATRDDAAFAGMEGADGELASPLLDHGNRKIIYFYFPKI